jgi:hypothetical protein
MAPELKVILMANSDNFWLRLSGLTDGFFSKYFFQTDWTQSNEMFRKQLVPRCLQQTI